MVPVGSANLLEGLVSDEVFKCDTARSACAGRKSGRERRQKLKILVRHADVMAGGVTNALEFVPGSASFGEDQDDPLAIRDAQSSPSGLTPAE